MRDEEKSGKARGTEQLVPGHDGRRIAGSETGARMVSGFRHVVRRKGLPESQDVAIAIARREFLHVIRCLHDWPVDDVGADFAGVPFG